MVNEKEEKKQEQKKKNQPVKKDQAAKKGADAQKSKALNKGSQNKAAQKGIGKSAKKNILKKSVKQTHKNTSKKALKKVQKKGNNQKMKITKKNSQKKTVKTIQKDKEHKKIIKKIRTSIRYRKPRRMKLPKNPHCPRIERSCYPKTLDKYSIIKNPLTSEKAMKRIEEMNTLVFICDRRANKRQIKKALKELYDIECEKINTLNCFAGDKKAYVRLVKSQDALNVANKIGIL